MHLGSKRISFQWLYALLFITVPWLEYRGNSLLRVDIPGLKLYFFGQVLRIEELILVVLALLIGALTIFLVTVVLGRVWCGWLCPQTLLSQIGEWLAHRLGVKTNDFQLQGTPIRKILLYFSYLLLSFLMAANILWYFVPPRLFFQRLWQADFQATSWLVLLVLWLPLFLDLALVRRLLCRDFCPYGRFQTALVDKATLTLHLPDSEITRCIDCHSCVRVCPMGIDIRRGYQVQCINCGLCLDACHDVMARRRQPGLIRYSFGQHGEGIGALLNPRVLLPGALIVILTIVLTFALLERKEASLKVARSHTVASRQLDGQTIGTFFSVWVHNRSQQRTDYIITARIKESRQPLILKGQTRATLKAGENRRLDFVVLSPRTKAPTPVVFILATDQGRTLTTAEASIQGMP